MSNLYSKYLSMLGLVMNFASVSLQLVVKSVLPLINYLKLTISDYSMLIKKNQSLHQNS